MKVAIVFLLVALNCYIGFGNAKHIATGAAHSDGPKISKECLQKLVKVDVPEVLLKLEELLCLYAKGKKDQNEELYKEFLKKLHEALKTAGCAVDEILTIEEFLEKVGDQVGEVAEQLGLELLKLVEQAGMSDLVLNTVCALVGETLKSLGESLSGGGGVADILKGIPIIG